MNKINKNKFLVKKLVAIGVAIAFVFAGLAFSACNNDNPNEGYIYGLVNARFVANFYRVPFHVNTSYVLPNAIIADRQELLAWHDVLLRTWSPIYDLESMSPDDIFSPRRFEEARLRMLADFDDVFFKTRQIIMRHSSSAIFEVQDINYQKGNLAINVGARFVPRTTSLDDLAPRMSIFEIPQMNSNFNVEYSIQRVPSR